MTSMLCTKTLEGNVQIYDNMYAEELQISEGEDSLRTTFMPRKKASFHHVVSPPSCGSDDSRTPLEASTLKGQSLFSGVHAKEIMNEMKKESDSAESLYGPLLATEKTFVQDVTQYLNHADTLSLRKKELLHKTWSSQVYEPMRRKILEVVHNSKEYAHKDRCHRELYRQYLEHTNKKGFVFLDTMDQGEYYAQALNAHRPAPITVKTASLQDPLLQQGRERSKEDQTILRCTTGEVYSLSDIEQIKLPPLPLVPLGRHSTNCLTWVEMPLGNIVSTPRHASRLRMKGNCTQSQIKFAHTPKTSVDTTVIDRELKSQKKRMFVNTPPFDRPPKPVLKPPFACCSELSTEGKMMCPVSA